MTQPSAALFTVKATGGPPSVADAAKQLGLTSDDLDQEFGVVLIDSSQGVYCVQTLPGHEPASAMVKDGCGGPFSNPAIEGFGPPKTDNRDK